MRLTLISIFTYPLYKIFKHRVERSENTNIKTFTINEKVENTQASEIEIQSVTNTRADDIESKSSKLNEIGRFLSASINSNIHDAIETDENTQKYIIMQRHSTKKQRKCLRIYI